MKLTGMGTTAAAFAALASVAILAGCRVHTEKDANGEEKKVQVDTPFGGIHVNTDQTTAADLGLPVYPGSQVVPDNGNDKSADVHMGFGEWELRVKIVNYATSDSEDKVTAFYKQALGHYGDVLSCQDGVAVGGSPAKTADGLVCEDKDHASVQISGDNASYGYHSTGTKGFQLKAGSRRHQHIVAFQSSSPGQTRFTLMALDLPGASAKGDSGKSN